MMLFLLFFDLGFDLEDGATLVGATGYASHVRLHCLAAFRTFYKQYFLQGVMGASSATLAGRYL